MAWRLVPLYEEEEYIQEAPSLRYRLYAGVTAFGNTAPLTVKRDPSEAEISASNFVFRGGRVHETEDFGIAFLWIASGFDVEEF